MPYVSYNGGMYELLEISKSFTDMNMDLLEYCFDQLKTMFPDVGLEIINDCIYAGINTTQEELNALSDAIRDNFRDWVMQFEGSSELKS
jgi:hypothetical protein